MGTFDWNRDGKTDWQEDMVFNEVISKDSYSGGDDAGEFPTLRSSNSSSPGNVPRRSASTQHYTGVSSEAGCLILIVAVITVVLCISALFMGYGNIIGDLLGFGLLAGMIALCIAK